MPDHLRAARVHLLVQLAEELAALLRALHGEMRRVTLAKRRVGHAVKGDAIEAHLRNLRLRFADEVQIFRGAVVGPVGNEGVEPERLGGAERDGQ